MPRFWGRTMYFLESCLYRVLLKFEKLFTHFKSVNHFFQMTDAVDHLLNDAVDHHRNPATVAGFRQARFWHWSVLEFENFCLNPVDRIPTKLAGIRRFCARFRPGQNGWILTIWLKFCQNDRILASWPEFGKNKWPDSDETGRIPTTVARILPVSDGITSLVIFCR